MARTWVDFKNEGDRVDKLQTRIDGQTKEIVIVRNGATLDGRVVEEVVSRRPMTNDEIRKYQNGTFDFSLRQDFPRGDDVRKREEEAARARYEQEKKEKENEEIEKRRLEKEEEKKINSREDATKVAPLDKLIKDINTAHYNYEQGNIKYGLFLKRKMQEFNDIVTDLHSFELRESYYGKLRLAENQNPYSSDGKTSWRRFNDYFERLDREIENDIGKYKSADLRRAKETAKRRYSNLSPLKKVVYLRQMLTQDKLRAAQLDELYMEELSNGKRK